MAIAAVAGVVRGVTGFGGSMVMTPPLALLFGPRAAIAAVLLLAAFYSKELLAPLKKPEPAYRFRSSPLQELIHHLGMRSDLRHARIRFAGTEMTITA